MKNITYIDTILRQYRQLIHNHHVRLQLNKRNNLVSREELADEEFDESELRKVDVGITRLRQKIEKIAKKPQFIKTIRGKGYMLVCREI